MKDRNLQDIKITWYVSITILNANYTSFRSYIKFFLPDGPTRNPVLNVNVTGEVNEGYYVSLTCDISGIDSNPELTIVKWTKDGQDIDWPDTSFTHTIEVTATDHGKYGCKVGNVIKGSPTYSVLSGLVELKVKGGGG